MKFSKILGKFNCLLYIFYMKKMKKNYPFSLKLIKILLKKKTLSNCEFFFLGGAWWNICVLFSFFLKQVFTSGDLWQNHNNDLVFHWLSHFGVGFFIRSPLFFYECLLGVNCEVLRGVHLWGTFQQTSWNILNSHSFKLSLISIWSPYFEENKPGINCELFHWEFTFWGSNFHWTF
jgi:hypothetical protein